eukprot:GAFH01000766.1.p1 GENE.GAFH01000766.1~~GAFH01000766.1.p1  ORF type:complete len:875 (-),score=50.10 GAFH01000766.1:660-3020(-)
MDKLSAFSIGFASTLQCANALQANVIQCSEHNNLRNGIYVRSLSTADAFRAIRNAADPYGVPPPIPPPPVPSVRRSPLPPPPVPPPPVPQRSESIAAASMRPTMHQTRREFSRPISSNAEFVKNALRAQKVIVRSHTGCRATFQLPQYAAEVIQGGCILLARPGAPPPHYPATPSRITVQSPEAVLDRVRRDRLLNGVIGGASGGVEDQPASHESLQPVSCLMIDDTVQHTEVTSLLIEIGRQISQQRRDFHLVVILPGPECPYAGAVEAYLPGHATMDLTSEGGRSHRDVDRHPVVASVHYVLNHLDLGLPDHQYLVQPPTSLTSLLTEWKMIDPAITVVGRLYLKLTTFSPKAVAFMAHFHMHACRDVVRCARLGALIDAGRIIMTKHGAKQADRDTAVVLALAQRKRGYRSDFTFEESLVTDWLATIHASPDGRCPNCAEAAAQDHTDGCPKLIEQYGLAVDVLKGIRARATQAEVVLREGLIRPARREHNLDEGITEALLVSHHGDIAELLVAKLPLQGARLLRDDQARAKIHSSACMLQSTPQEGAASQYVIALNLSSQPQFGAFNMTRVHPLPPQYEPPYTRRPLMMTEVGPDGGIPHVGTKLAARYEKELKQRNVTKFPVVIHDAVTGVLHILVPEADVPVVSQALREMDPAVRASTAHTMCLDDGKVQLTIYDGAVSSLSVKEAPFKLRCFPEAPPPGTDPDPTQVTFIGSRDVLLTMSSLEELNRALRHDPQARVVNSKERNRLVEVDWPLDGLRDKEQIEANLRSRFAYLTPLGDP